MMLMTMKMITISRVERVTLLSVGEWVRPGAPSCVGTETDPAVRDAACPPRNDDSRTVWSRQDAVHPSVDEGHDRLRRTTQRDEDESKSYNSSADVWSPRRRYQWLDWRNLFYALEKDAQDQEGEILLRAGNPWKCLMFIRKLQLLLFWRPLLADDVLMTTNNKYAVVVCSSVPAVRPWNRARQDRFISV